MSAGLCFFVQKSGVDIAVYAPAWLTAAKLGAVMASPDDPKVNTILIFPSPSDKAGPASGLVSHPRVEEEPWLYCAKELIERYGGPGSSKTVVTADWLARAVDGMLDTSVDIWGGWNTTSKHIHPTRDTADLNLPFPDEQGAEPEAHRTIELHRTDAWRPPHVGKSKRAGPAKYRPICNANETLIPPKLQRWNSAPRPMTPRPTPPPIQPRDFHLELSKTPPKHKRPPCAPLQLGLQPDAYNLSRKAVPDARGPPRSPSPASQRKSTGARAVWPSHGNDWAPRVNTATKDGSSKDSSSKEDHGYGDEFRYTRGRSGIGRYQSYQPRYERSPDTPWRTPEQFDCERQQRLYTSYQGQTYPYAGRSTPYTPYIFDSGRTSSSFSDTPSIVLGHSSRSRSRSPRRLASREGENLLKTQSKIASIHDSPPTHPEMELSSHCATRTGEEKPSDSSSRVEDEDALASALIGRQNTCDMHDTIREDVQARKATPTTRPERSLPLMEKAPERWTNAIPRLMWTPIGQKSVETVRSDGNDPNVIQPDQQRVTRAETSESVKSDITSITLSEPTITTPLPDTSGSAIIDFTQSAESCPVLTLGSQSSPDQCTQSPDESTAEEVKPSQTEPRFLTIIGPAIQPLVSTIDSIALVPQLAFAPLVLRTPSKKKRARVLATFKKVSAPLIKPVDSPPHFEHVSTPTVLPPTQREDRFSSDNATATALTCSLPVPPTRSNAHKVANTSEAIFMQDQRPLTFFVAPPQLGACRMDFSTTQYLIKRNGGTLSPHHYGVDYLVIPLKNEDDSAIEAHQLSTEMEDLVRSKDQDTSVVTRAWLVESVVKGKLQDHKPYEVILSVCQTGRPVNGHTSAGTVTPEVRDLSISPRAKKQKQGNELGHQAAKGASLALSECVVPQRRSAVKAAMAIGSIAEIPTTESPSVYSGSVGGSTDNDDSEVDEPLAKRQMPIVDPGEQEAYHILLRYLKKWEQKGFNGGTQKAFFESIAHDKRAGWVRIFRKYKSLYLTEIPNLKPFTYTRKSKKGSRSH